LRHFLFFLDGVTQEKFRKSGGKCIPIHGLFLWLSFLAYVIGCFGGVSKSMLVFLTRQGDKDLMADLVKELRIN
ncbi:hypothetical protein, partial [Acinetobacter baumannii]|uniref:hypothetical protein n=1 Tax=Acinetobacter baumannii TaxID=470 RepID=UPI001BC875CB